MRPGTLQGHLGTPHLDSLDNTVLDAVDADGRITYYTSADRQGILFRQRAERGTQHNEVFIRDGLRWDSTDPLPSSADNAADFGLIWLDEMEAANLIAAAVTTTAD